jgi:uncharacterized protein YneF (UPF0154 family)
MKANVLLTVAILLLLAGGAGGTYYFYDKYQTAQNILDNPDIAAQEEVRLLTEKLGKLIVLPEDEEPTVATVLDKAGLQDQPFFQKAENGDRVVIYTKAAQAILYRPSENKIIAVAPITITQPESPPPASRPPSPKVQEEGTESDQDETDKDVGSAESESAPPSE